MTTLNNGSKNILKEAYEIAIYKSLGEELSDELKNAGCELKIDIDAKEYEFINCPQYLQDKINAKRKKS
jgi:hypothetical protein